MGYLFRGYITSQIEIGKTDPVITVTDFDGKLLNHSTVNKDGFLNSLSEFYIGEWQNDYDPLRFGEGILDGIQWTLKFVYDGKHKEIEIGGSNDYPYNFKEFIKLLRLDEYFDIGL